MDALEQQMRTTESHTPRAMARTTTTLLTGTAVLTLKDLLF